MRSYIVQYRNRVGQSKRKTLGRHGVLTAEEARNRARAMLSGTKDGDDPVTDNREARDAAAGTSLCERYMRAHATPHKKPSSAKEDQRLINNKIIPALGTSKVATVNRTDISKIHHQMRNTPYEANRTMGLIRKIFNLAELWGLRPDGSNPCRHIQRYKEKQRERFLSVEEAKALGKVLNQAEKDGTEQPVFIAVIRLLLLTGSRLSEICALRWDYIDIDRGAARLPDSKTGAKTIHLGEAALDVISGVPGSEGYLFNAVRDDDKPLSKHAVEKAWKRIRLKAELPDVRLHDLRHTFASWSVMSGQTLYMTGGLLGHASAQTTSRYAHLAADPLRQAADTVSETLAAALANP